MLLTHALANPKGQATIISIIKMLSSQQVNRDHQLFMALTRPPFRYKNRQRLRPASTPRPRFPRTSGPLL
eukprot:4629359-Pyramimonas_sp.AAC.1